MVALRRPGLGVVAGGQDFGDAVGGDPDLPLPVGGSGVVWFDQVVVVAADEDEVGEAGRAAVLPRDEVVGVAGLGGAVTAGEHAALVAGVQRVAEVGGDEALGASDVEDAGGAAEHEGDQVGVAQQLPGLAG